MPAGTTRPRKTPAERAQLDLDAAIKRRDTAQKKVSKLEEGLEPAKAELQQSSALVDYLSKNPLLPENQAGDVDSGELVPESMTDDEG